MLMVTVPHGWDALGETLGRLMADKRMDEIARKVEAEMTDEARESEVRIREANKQIDAMEEALAAERERCAKIADRMDSGDLGNAWCDGYEKACDDIAAKIRSGE